MIISCDWGTTSFRLRAVEYPSGRVVAFLHTDEGILTTFGDWQRSGLPEQQRAGFYRAILHTAIDRLQRENAIDLHGSPMILSGMASSSIGILELPYHSLPFDTTGGDLQPALLLPKMDFPHLMILVPGIRSGDDVIRGEETQLIGCHPSGTEDERVYLFPGTHSKHLVVHDGKAIAFSTFMTGEFFHLLAHKSILSASVANPANPASPASTAPAHPSLTTAFYAGIDASRHTGILHTGFSVRTNQLFHRLTPEENYQYLSGLLIGEELKGLGSRPLTLVSAPPLLSSYLAALQYLGAPPIGIIDADRALVSGHCTIYARHLATA
jgi:2-dehydro-3-deoxygalactonokinase